MTPRSLRRAAIVVVVGRRPPRGVRLERRRGDLGDERAGRRRHHDSSHDGGGGDRRSAGHVDRGRRRRRPSPSTSTAFGDNEPIPQKYTCQGDGVSPALRWSGVPDGTKSLALLVVDPDAAVEGGFTHWVLDRHRSVRREAGRGLRPKERPAQAARASPGTRVPCPPSGTHHYVFTLYALPAPIEGTPDRAAIEAAAATSAGSGRADRNLREELAVAHSRTPRPPPRSPQCYWCPASSPCAPRRCGGRAETRRRACDDSRVRHLPERRDRPSRPRSSTRW